jgi:FtsP/CotA-like multicopper oxidase with cupredoxin domain
MTASRRNFLRGGMFLTAGLLSGRVLAGQQQHEHHAGMPMPGKRVAEPVPSGPAQPLGAGVLPIETPDLPKLRWEMENGVKVFHLVAEPVQREFLPGRSADVWGYNGSMPGPTIEANQGDRVRIIVENHLPEVTSMHWHGLEIPPEMDGTPGLDQDPIPPRGRYVYEFTVHQAGTFFYHSHMAMQEMMGMIGLFILHPAEPSRPRVDKDFGLVFQEFAVLPNNTVPNSMSMEFNWLTINGKAGPATTPMLVRLGERVRIRMVNLGMDHHPIHLHGNTFYVTGTEAGRVPDAAWTPANTVLLGVAQARDIEFDAKYAGDWMLHCHMPHHMMNQMASMVGPMTHAGHGMPSGMGMMQGMGMLQQGAALAPENGPSLGRGLGISADYEKPVTNLALAGRQMDQHMHPQAAAGAVVPGYPQDHFMAMDDEVAKPETYGLRPTWSGGMMGMMTLVRVLEPALYDKIRELQSRARG